MIKEYIKIHYVHPLRAVKSIKIYRSKKYLWFRKCYEIKVHGWTFKFYNLKSYNTYLKSSAGFIK